MVLGLDLRCLLWVWLLGFIWLPVYGVLRYAGLLVRFMVDCCGLLLVVDCGIVSRCFCGWVVGIGCDREFFVGCCVSLAWVFGCVVYSVCCVCLLPCL